MPFAWNLPYLSVFLTMIAAILLSVLPGAKRAYWITVGVSAAVTVMSLCFLVFIRRADASYAFTMGKFPAPFGNEIKFGPLQGLFASVFAAVMCLSLLGGRVELFEDVDEKKMGLACVMFNMVLASLLILTYTNDAFTAYQLGDMAKASNLFKSAADASTLAPCAEVNNDAAYNAAFTAMQIKDYNRATEYYNKCLSNGFLSEGNIYANLSECALAQADTLKAKNYLATGLTAFPDNAAILTNLINLYLQTNEDPAKIVELLDEAKKAMPDNPSLYYVEGNIYTGIKKYDEAIAAYDNGLKINDKYDMCYYGKANVALKKGEDIVEEMNALDVKEWKKYDELAAKLTDVYVSALEPFEKCYEVSQIPEVKAAAADYLKRLNFQLRNVDPKYQQAYEKWNGIVAAE